MKRRLRLNWFSYSPPLFYCSRNFGEDTILTRAATITTRIGASRVASTHTRRSAPVPPAQMMDRALPDDLLFLRARTAGAIAVNNPMAPTTQVWVSSTDMTSTELNTALRFILHVDTIDVRPPMVFSIDSKKRQLTVCSCTASPIALIYPEMFDVLHIHTYVCHLHQPKRTRTN